MSDSRLLMTFETARTKPVAREPWANMPGPLSSDS